MTFHHLSSHALTARLVELVATERCTVVEFILHLVELEQRGLYLELGYPSTFAFLVGRLKLTKASAFRRSEAARLVARHPVIVDYLRDGRLSLTTLVELRKLLTEENHRELLGRAAGKTEDQVKELVAALAPREAPPDLFRRLPPPKQSAASLLAPPSTELPATATVTAIGGPPAPACATDTATATDPPGSGPETPISPDPCQPVDPAGPLVPKSARRRATVEPISADQYVIRFTVGKDFVDDLAKVKALLSHTIPDGKLEEILHACIRRTIAECEKRRRGSSRPRPRKVKAAPKGRTISTEVSREVWDRDGGTCAYTAPDGKRCGSDYQVQVHHMQPYSRKGPPTVANLELRCRPHNRYAADKDFGREFMARVAKSTRGPQGTTSISPPGSEQQGSGCPPGHREAARAGS